MTLQESIEFLNVLKQETLDVVALIGNGLMLGFRCDVNDSPTWMVTLEPTWRYERDGKVVLGSRDLVIQSMDFPSEAEYEARFHALCGLVHPVRGSSLLQIEVDQQSSDICLYFSSGHVLRNFADSAFEGHAWSYHDVGHGIVVDVGPAGVSVRKQSQPG